MSVNMAAAARPKTCPPSFQLIVASGCLAAGFGLLEGIIQAARMALKVPEPMGWPILWVTPAFYALVGVLYGAGLAIGIWWVRRFLRSRARISRMLPVYGLGLLAIIGYYNALSLLIATGHWATWIVALGLGYQTVRLLDLRRDGAIVLLNRLAPWMAGLIVVLAATVSLGNHFAKQAFLAGLPPAKSGAPNVLLITVDTLRADHVGAYGYGRPTPTLDTLAREGLQFDYAIATSSWTLPSHATLMTGLLPHEHLAEMMTGGRLDERFRTLAEAFSESGYASAAFVANEYACAANLGFGQGFGHFNDLFWSIADSLRWTKLGERVRMRLALTEALRWPQMGRKTAEEINLEAVHWLSGRPNRPFFAWLNYYDSHDPYYAPAKSSTRYGEKPVLGDPGSYGVLGASDWDGVLSPEETRWQIDAYDTAIAHTDEKLGELFDALRAAGLYDETIIVVTSDHGEAFGDHGLYGHANSLYRETLHVPLIIRYPRSISAGSHVTTTVSLRDLAGTMVALAGIQPAQAFPGQPLHLGSGSQPVLAELMHNPYHPSSHPVARGALESITTDQLHVIYLRPSSGAATQTEIYARDDVADQKNLVDTPAGQEAIRQLEANQPAH